jgi:1-acyl-sn-glycerol-3-phosphate acyltransferase
MKLAELGKPARILLSGSSFVFFWGGSALLTWLVLPFEVRRRLPDSEKSRRSRKWVQRGFRAFHDYMRFWGLTDFDPRKVDLDLPPGPYVMIANHPTLIDVTSIMSAVDDLAVVVKGDLWKAHLARLLGNCGHINGGDGGTLSSASTVVQALERLEEGQPVLIFPEGTRSPEDELHPFQRGAFEAAKRAGVPIVPVFVATDPAWLMKHQRWYDVPDGMNRMRVLPLEGAAIKPPPRDQSSKRVARLYEDLYKNALTSWLNNGRRSGMVRD